MIYVGSQSHNISWPPPVTSDLLAAGAGSERRAAATTLLSLLARTLWTPVSVNSEAKTNPDAPLILSRKRQHAAATEAADPTTSEDAEHAVAWTACGGAFALVLRFEEPDVIEAVIEFWRRICGRLDGTREQQQQQPEDGQQSSAPSTPAAVQQRLHAAWLWRAGPCLLTAVVAQAHAFYMQTGISHLHRPANHAIRPQCKMLLMLLQLTADAGAAAGCEQRAPAAPAQLLGLLGRMLVHPQRPHAAAMRPAASHALSCGEAFAVVSQLLQLSAVDANAAAWQLQVSKPEEGSSPDAPHPKSLLLAHQAGRFLFSGYFAPASEPAHTPSLSDYDACMISLAAALVEASPSPAAVGPEGKSGAAAMPPALHSSGHQKTAGAFSSARGRHGSSALADDPVEGAIERCGGLRQFKALSQLLASYPRWDVLLKGLFLCLASDAADGGGSGAAGTTSRRSAAGAAAAASSALAVLAHVAGVAEAAAEEASRTAALLFGLSALTRPDSGCGVEWRVEALVVMERSASGFVDEYPGKHELGRSECWCSTGCYFLD